MRTSNPCLIYKLFKTQTISLARLQKRAMMILSINRIVSDILPSYLRPWCRVANIHKNILVLEIANASWKMCLYYKQNQLLSVLRSSALPSLFDINIKINPNLAIKKDLNNQYYWFFKKKSKKLSLKSATYIHNIAAYSEGNLKSALERLAKLAIEKY